MQWEDTTLGKLPVKSWCGEVEKGTLEQAMKSVVYSGWHECRGGGRKMKGMLDLSEAPQVY